MQCIVLSGAVTLARFVTVPIIIFSFTKLDRFNGKLDYAAMAKASFVSIRHQNHFGGCFVALFAV